MLYREIIAVCSQIHTKHINTLCGQNVELLNVKLVVHILTTRVYSVKAHTALDCCSTGHPDSNSCSFVTVEMLKPVNKDVSHHTALTGHLSCRSCRQCIKPTVAPPVDSLLYHHSVQSTNSPPASYCINNYFCIPHF